MEINRLWTRSFSEAHLNVRNIARQVGRWIRGRSLFLTYFSFCVAACALVVGCNKEKKGGIVLAISTDTKLAGISSVAVVVRETGSSTPLFSRQFKIEASQPLQLPFTFGIAPKKEGQQFDISVIAFHQNLFSTIDRPLEPFILRHVRVALSKNRLSLLRMPLEWFSWGSAGAAVGSPLPDPNPLTGLSKARAVALKPCDADSEIQIGNQCWSNPVGQDFDASWVLNPCPDGQTNIGGLCQSSVVDENNLPHFSDSLYLEQRVFGGTSKTNAAAEGDCFDSESGFMSPLPLFKSGTSLTKALSDLGDKRELSITGLSQEEAASLNIAIRFRPVDSTSSKSEFIIFNHDDGLDAIKNSSDQLGTSSFSVRYEVSNQTTILTLPLALTQMLTLLLQGRYPGQVASCPDEVGAQCVVYDRRIEFQLYRDAAGYVPKVMTLPLCGGSAGRKLAF